MPATFSMSPLTSASSPSRRGSWSKQRASAWSCTTRCRSCLLLTPDSRRKHPATMSRRGPPTLRPARHLAGADRGDDVQSALPRPVSSPGAAVPAHSRRSTARSSSSTSLRSSTRPCGRRSCGRWPSSPASAGRRSCSARRPFLHSTKGLATAARPNHSWTHVPAAVNRFVVRSVAEPWNADRVVDEAERRLRTLGSAAVILNTVRDAVAVFRKLRARGGRWFFLASRMLPGHKEQIIRQIRKSLENKAKPTGVVCTQVLEAGVDLSFRAILGRCRSSRQSFSRLAVAIDTARAGPPRSSFFASFAMTARTSGRSFTVTVTQSTSPTRSSRRRR